MISSSYIYFHCHADTNGAAFTAAQAHSGVRLKRRPIKTSAAKKKHTLSRWNHLPGYGSTGGAGVARPLNTARQMQHVSVGSAITAGRAQRSLESIHTRRSWGESLLSVRLVDHTWRRFDVVHYYCVPAKST